MISPGTLVLGKYRIVGKLGEGGMGTVYHARDELLDREVAIKLLRSDLAGQAALSDRFRGEAVALARLTHPGIAALHGLERDGEQLHMVMEFVRGETLEARIQRGGALPWPEAVAICAAVCDALDHAHRQGVVHRDIKPANLMLAPDRTVKVMDFGIARMAGQSRQTRLGSTVGTPHYMAPEQLRGEEVDGRADLYALGIVLYELIAGRVPFDADSDYQLMMLQLHEAAPHLSREVTGVPAAVDRLVIRAMAKDPAARFSSAAEMAAALQGALAQRGTDPSVAVDEAATPLTRDWRTWSAAAMVVAALVLLFGGGDRTPAAPPTPAPTPPPTAAATAPETRLPAELSAGGAASGPSTSGAVPTPAPTPAPVRPTPRPPSANPPPPATRRQAEATQPPPAARVTPPPPPAVAPVRTDPSQAVQRAVSQWLGGLRSRDPGGVTGTVGKDALADLIREGRASVESGTPRLSIDGDRAAVTVDATIAVRSSFGAARKVPATLRLTLQERGDAWRVTAASVTAQ